jgi:hypothetical protein
MYMRLSMVLILSLSMTSLAYAGFHDGESAYDKGGSL